MTRRNKLWTDAEMLEALHLLDRGLTREMVGRRFGVTKSAIIGMVQRIRWETDASDPTGHLNGTFPSEWWRDGLRRRRR